MFNAKVLKRTFIVLSLITLCSSSMVTSLSSFSLTPSENGFVILAQSSETAIFHEGNVDSIRIAEYDNITEALAAVDAGQADVFGHRINASDYDLVDTYSNINKQWAYEATTCLLAINTEIYPLSNVHLRRAIAFAIDKNNITTNAMDGIVDSVDFALPLFSEFSIEETHGGLFYTSNITDAESELAQAGMLDIDEDLVVEAPNGNEVVFTIWYPADVNGMNDTAQMISDDLIDAGINNTIVGLNYTELQYEVGNHNQSYNLALYDQEMPKYGFRWTAVNFHYTQQTVFGRNIANINDLELDSIAERYADSINFDQTVALGIDALFAVRDLCPVIPIFNYRWLSVYSDENLEGWVDDNNAGAFSAWNSISVTPRSGSESELVVAVVPQFFDDFFTSLNPFAVNLDINEDWVEGQRFNPYMLVYDSPLATLPNGEPVPREATSWEMQFLGQVSDIEAWQSRATFYCDPNANWTDGEQLDAEDYRFTFEYFANNTLANETGMIDDVKVIGTHTAGVTYNSHEMFIYRWLGNLPILPEHIWEGRDPRTWDLTVEEIVGSGPYMISSFTQGSSLELAQNPNYYPEVDIEPPTLRTLVMIPEEPIPAESVVFRVTVDDRSRIANLTLSYTYLVGVINFTESQLMVQDVSGYEATIPARVTASAVTYEVAATDIWGNTAIIATGSYSRSTTEPTGTIDLVIPLIAGIAVIAITAIIMILRRRRS
ncbi:MAG: ABC transporter substrate-binding protein [Candidatus Thorarchaeota archaeon]|jgi:ABC-type transport system substrate-binding protein